MDGIFSVLCIMEKKCIYFTNDYIFVNNYFFNSPRALFYFKIILEFIKPGGTVTINEAITKLYILLTVECSILCQRKHLYYQLFLLLLFC